MPLSNALSLKQEVDNSGFSTADWALLATGEIFTAFIRDQTGINLQVGLLSPPDSYSRLVLVGNTEQLADVVTLLKAQNLSLITMPGLTLADCVRLCEIEDEIVITLSACPQFIGEYARLLQPAADRPAATDTDPAVAQAALTL